MKVRIALMWLVVMSVVLISAPTEIFANENTELTGVGNTIAEVRGCSLSLEGDIGLNFFYLSDR